jgi:hypothetical protein
LDGRTDAHLFGFFLRGVGGYHGGFDGKHGD